MRRQRGRSRKRQRVQTRSQSQTARTAAEEQTDTPGPPEITDLAHPLLRLVAAVIDVALVVALLMFLSVATGGWFLGGARTSYQDVGVFLAYFILPTALKGQTIGKWAVGIQVIDQEGRVPGIAVAIPREMAGKFISAVALGMGFVSIIFDAKHQGWHDRFMNTYVVNRRQPSKSWRRTIMGRFAGTNRDAAAAGERQE